MDHEHDNAWSYSPCDVVEFQGIVLISVSRDAADKDLPSSDVAGLDGLWLV